MNKLYVNKMDNLEEKDKYQDMYSLSRQNQKEIENMNRSVINTEPKIVISYFKT